MTLVTDLRAALEPFGDADRSEKMRAYLKTEMPMLGVSRPDQKRMFRETFARHVPADRAAWESSALALQAEPEREFRYAAIAWTQGFRKKHLVPASVPLLERLIVEGAWWDLVDDLAVHSVGPIVARHRAELDPILDAWIEHEDLWLRRTAILAQIALKPDQVDEQQLFRYCRAQAADKTFWIRKAIGWALRDHARDRPDPVRAFLAAHGEELSGLSRREASKHL